MQILKQSEDRIPDSALCAPRLQAVTVTFWASSVAVLFFGVLIFFSFFFLILFNFTILYWFCHISKWICHRYTCGPHPEPSSFLPPPSPFHPSGSSQCTSPKHPVSCIEPGLATIKIFFFWCGPFLVFIEFITILLLFYVLVFWPQACGIFAPRPGIEPTSPALEGPGLPGKSQEIYF